MTGNFRTPAVAGPGMSVEAMKQFVKDHFEDFVNRKISQVAHKNFSSDFLDHDEPSGVEVGPDAAQQMMEAAAYRRWPDLHVTVEDTLAEGDKVMVRNSWTAAEAATGSRIEFHGFVLWRFANGKIVERWATISSPKPVHAPAT